MQVDVRGSSVGAVDAALKVLRRKLMREGLIAEFKHRASGYLKPGEKRRKKT